MKSLISVWKSRGQIMEGITNSIFTRQDVEIIADARMSVCLDCEQLDTKGDKCLVAGTQPCCGECGCKLGWKTRSLSSSCPLGKWNAELTDEEAKLLEQKLTLD